MRWALVEAGLVYEERLIGAADQSSPSYRALQPSGQVPAYEEDGLVLFESGAIVLHIAERADALMPPDPAGRARTSAWMFAALNTVEPAVMFLNEIDRQQAGEGSAKPARSAAVAAVNFRLASLCSQLHRRDYLEDRFTAADLLMTTVLRNLRETDLVTNLAVLEAYQFRCEARPAFQKALADQMAAFAENAPASASA